MATSKRGKVIAVARQRNCARKHKLTSLRRRFNPLYNSPFMRFHQVLCANSPPPHCHSNHVIRRVWWTVDRIGSDRITDAYHRLIVVFVDMYKADLASGASDTGRRHIVVHCDIKHARRPVRRPPVAIDRRHANWLLIRIRVSALLVSYTQ